MSFQLRRSPFGLLVVGVALLLLQLAGSAFAAGNWENGDAQYHSICINCHNTDPTQSNGGGAFPAPAGNSASTIQALINGDMGSPFTDGLHTASSATINDTVSDVAAYLNGHLTYPKASFATVTSTTFTAVAVGLTSTRTFRITNSGTATLSVSSVSISDTTNFSVSNACPTVAASSSCDLTVTFQPQSVGTFSGRTLTINHNAFSTSSSIGGLSGTGQQPFDVSPTLLTFTDAAVPGHVLVTNVTDRKGDRIQVCRVAASSTFSFPEDYSIDAPNALGPDGCFTAPVTGAVPRTIALNVRFTAGAVGPRDGALRIRRVDGSGNPLAGTVTTIVQLQGNPGPLATVDASSLFDAVADPGVEVDNDNILDRQVTVFSEGSQALTGGTFVISGPSSSEYTLASNGCQAGLAAFTGSTPPSCVLTVRFNPSDVGRRGPATLTIHFASTTDNTISLDGLGIRGPRLAVRRGGLALASGDAVQFGAQTQGGLYPSIPVTLTNGGTVGNLDVVLPVAGSVAGFTFVADAGCATLAPAASCTVALHFDPAAVQLYDSPFAIQSRASGSSAAFNEFQIDLRGQGTVQAVPVLSWTDTTGTPISRLDFPDTDTGAPNTRNVRLYNDGPGGVLLEFANVVGLDAQNFVLDTAACPGGQVLFEKTSCQIAVQFAPGTAGLKSASIQMAASVGTPAMPVVPPLLVASGTGIGTSAPATLVLSAAALTFDDTVVGAAGLPLEIRLTNNGSRSLSVLTLDAAAPFVVQSKTCAALPFALPPGGECTVTVTFHPQAQGNLSGSLTITTDASATPLAVALSGRGAEPADLSSGGCSIAARDSLTDPTLWALVALALVALVYRRRTRR